MGNGKLPDEFPLHEQNVCSFDECRAQIVNQERGNTEIIADTAVLSVICLSTRMPVFASPC